MPVFLCRLAPPRPTFPADMKPEEGAAMQRHFGFWAERMQEGTAHVVGPVMDPKGTYGVAIVSVADRAAAEGLCTQDPVITAQLGFAYEVFEMPNASVREDAAPA